MIGRGLFLLTILSSCVLSLPVTSSQLENEDVKVMKCIVEALADVLSRPHPMPVSQECLATLKTDDRLVTILRHQNFLKEMQEIAAQGGRGRADTPTAAAPTLQATDDVPDRSMLEALGGPGERSILSKRTGAGKDEKEAGMEDGELQGDNEAEEVQVKRESDESPGSHVSDSAEEWREGEDEKREEDEEGYDKKRAEEISEEESKDDGSDEKRDTRRKKSKDETSDEEEETTKRLSLFHKNKGKEETKRGNRESLQRWTKATKPLLLKKKAATKEEQHEVPHHSKEMAEEKEEEKKRNAQKSPEEKELQMIARRAPEERRGLEEEGSASRKSEEPEIESLAAIESELENVAQKLHELRRG
ncbi:chromogranin-A [Simochromis diagramma]|uniref:chromogranin-A n=1 Tax=Simochromis diagramma TaxID=43689 RepID=UPI001A7E6991|nr:chromogranin-A [Simochromis diagramma]